MDDPLILRTYTIPRHERTLQALATRHTRGSLDDDAYISALEQAAARYERFARILSERADELRRLANDVQRGTAARGH